MRFSLLVAVAATMLSGCLSSSPTVRTYSASADKLNIKYAGDRGGIADTLLARGCTTQSTNRYWCTIESLDGPLVVALAFSGPVVPSPTRERVEATQEGATQRETEVERSLPVGETYSVAPTRTSTPSLPQRTAEPIPTLGLRAWASVLDGDTPILLVGDDTEAIRKALYGLLIRDLPVIRAAYVD